MLFFARINLTTPLRQRETHRVCLFCSAESATEAISLALHSVPRVFHLALRACETRSQCVCFAPPRAPLKPSLLHSIVFHMLLRVCETRSQCVPLAPPRAPLKPSLLHSIVFHMLSIPTLHLKTFEQLF